MWLYLNKVSNYLVIYIYNFIWIVRYPEYLNILAFPKHDMSHLSWNKSHIKLSLQFCIWTRMNYPVSGIIVIRYLYWKSRNLLSIVMSNDCKNIFSPLKSSFLKNVCTCELVNFKWLLLYIQVCIPLCVYLLCPLSVYAGELYNIFSLFSYFSIQWECILRLYNISNISRTYIV